MLDENETSTENRLVLGFDASCGKCSTMAQQLKSDAGSALDVLPLSNPEMHRWRHDVFTEPPWAPTLIRVGDDDRAIGGWVGWKIGPVLGTTLGPQRAATALQHIGEMRLAANGGRLGTVTRSKTSRRGLARLALGAAGLVAGAATVAGMSGTAFAKGKPVNLQVSDEEPLAESAAVSMLGKHFETEDAKNVLTFSAAGSGTATLNRLSSGKAGGAPEVGAKRMTLADGTISEASYTYDKAIGEMLVVQENTELVDGQASIAWILDVAEGVEGFADSSFTIRQKSVNGALVRRLDQSLDSEGRQSLQLADEEDPCGGCNGICRIGGEEFRESCYSSSVVACFLSAAGCAGCIACSGTGACVFCAITSCGGVLLSCCDQVTGPACERCNRVC